MTISDRLARLGYVLRRNQRDCFGKLWAYRTSPNGNGGGCGGGPTNYFASIADVAKYAQQVEQVRQWQTGDRT